MTRFFTRFALTILISLGAAHCAPNRPQEDDPGWNCQTQGNGICGPTTINLLNHTIIARNGVFAYLDSKEYQVGNSPITICVSGISPLTHKYTALACSRSFIPQHLDP